MATPVVMPISEHGGIVPFTSCSAEYGITPPVNVIRGTAGPPLSIPAAPRRNRCFALRSPPDLLPAVGSTRRPCLASPLAAIHGVQPLSSGLRFADFSGESTPVPRSGRRVAGGRKPRTKLPGAGVARAAAASPLARSSQRNRHKAEMP